MAELSRPQRPEGTTTGAVVRLWLLVLAFTTVTVTCSWRTGISVKDPGGGLLLFPLGTSLRLLVIFSLGQAAVRPGLALSPTTVWRRLRERCSARRVRTVLLALLAYHVVYLDYRNLKSWDVLNAPRDSMLLRWDRWLFLGHSPALLLHDLLGQGLADTVLVVWYESFAHLVSLSFVAALVLQDRLRQGLVYIASACWVWIMGTASYYLIPSLGPFWSAPQDFAGLPRSTVTINQATYLAQRLHLLADPHAPDAYAQVSAFASLHVGVTTLMLLMARYYGLRWTSRLLSVFLVGTLVATIYLGWHFAVDDVAGLILGWTGVRLGRWLVEPSALHPAERAGVPARRPGEDAALGPARP